jgi:hypothetical protein
MGWNYRVLRCSTQYDEWFYGIHEVYYDGDMPSGHSVKEARVGGHSILELRDVLKMMSAALDKPVLEFNPEGGYTEVVKE